MLSFGLCESPGFLVPPNIQEQLNPPFYRTILYKLSDLDAIKAQGKPVIITLNNECAEVAGDWSGWSHTIFRIQEILGTQLLLFNAGNELDRFDDTPPQFAAELANTAARILKFYKVPVAATSLAGSNWPSYASAMSPLLVDDVQYLDFHPYGKQPDGWGPPNWMFGKLRDAITHLRSLNNNRDVICTEVGVKLRDVGSANEVGNFMKAAYTTLQDMNVKYASWFAWHDLVGAPSERGLDAFGLIDEYDKWRPASTAYMNINAKVPTPPVPTKVDLSAWAQRVGAGILAMMSDDNTEPAMASEWRPFDRPKGTPATIEECIGLNGVTYRWHLPSSKHGRIAPTSWS